MKKVITIQILVLAFFLVTNADAQTAYITDGTTGNCFVIDLTANVVTHVIPGVFGPVAVSADGTRVYVANGDVQVLNTATNTLIASIHTLGTNLSGIAISADGSRVYVVDGPDNLIYVINAATNTIIDSVTVGLSPDAAIVSSDGSRLYVADWSELAVNVINTTTNTVIANITDSSSSQDIAISPDGSRLYITNYATESISVINTATNTIIATINSGAQSFPEGIAVSPDGTKIYVATSNLNTITVISAAADTIITTIPVDNSPYGVSVSPDGSRVVVDYLSTGSIATVINTLTNTVIANVPISPGYLGALGNYVSSYTPPCSAVFTLFPDTSQQNHYEIINYASGIPPLHYLWSWGDSHTDTISAPSHTYADTGIYTICLSITDSSGCQSTFCDSSYDIARISNLMAYITVISNSHTGIKTIEAKNEISVYPNPATTTLTIHQSTPSPNQQLIITDLLGTEVYKEKLTGIDNTIFISTWSAGIYFFEVRSQNTSMRGKFVVQK
jgi:YVTN family beta-propeller protein